MGIPRGSPVDAEQGSGTGPQALTSEPQLSGRSGQLRDRLHRLKQEPVFALAALAMAVAVAVFIALPVGYVLVESFFVDGQFSLDNWRAVPGTARFRAAILNSLMLGVVATSLTIAFAVPLALYTTRHPGPLSRAFRIISLLPLVAPPFVFALSLMLVAGRRGILTDWLRPLLELVGFSDPAIFGLHGVAIAQMLG